MCAFFVFADHNQPCAPSWHHIQLRMVATVLQCRTNVDGAHNAVSADFVYYAVLDGAVPTEILKQVHAVLLAN